MKITLFAHGLRGDVWPLVALGWNLARLDHEVTIAVTDEFRSLAERAGLRTAHLWAVDAVDHDWTDSKMCRHPRLI